MCLFLQVQKSKFSLRRLRKFARILRILASTVPAYEIFIPVHCSPPLFIILSFCEYIYIKKNGLQKLFIKKKFGLQKYFYLFFKKKIFRMVANFRMFAKFHKLRKFATYLPQFCSPILFSP